MKSFLILACLILTARVPAGETPRPTVHASLPAALAVGDGAPILVVFQAAWHPSSQTLDTLLASNAFLDKAERLHLVQVDPALSPALIRTWQVERLPELMLLNPDGVILARWPGFPAAEARTAEPLLAWLKSGRQTGERGEWLGVATSRQTVVADAEILGLLGSSDPARRNQGLALVNGRSDSERIGLLLAGFEHAHLAIRATCVDLAARQFPAAPLPDPWAIAAERTAQIRTFIDWQANPTKPESAAASSADSTRRLRQALAGLDSEGASRTTAMTDLVGLGAEVLPALRQEAATLSSPIPRRCLELVRWLILIPGTVEDRSLARLALATGSPDARRQATTRLGKGDPKALPVLQELTRDGDALVVEQALQGLKAIKSAGSVASLAQALTSQEANARMVAAQALGQSKNPTAALALAGAAQDPDEVVACTALASLIELTSDKEAQPSAEVQTRLHHALADPRWRVRAAAVEAIGKMKVRDIGLRNRLRALVNDPDAFVVKACLTACQTLYSPIPSPQLRELALNRPELCGAIASALFALFEQHDLAALAALAEIYQKLPAQRRDLLSASVSRYSNHDDKADPEWKPLVTAILADPDPRLRSGVVPLLRKRSLPLAAEALDRLLADPDPTVVKTALPLLFTVVAAHWGAGHCDSDARLYGILLKPAHVEPAKTKAKINDVGGILRTFRKHMRKNIEEPSDPIQERQQVADLHAAWHARLAALATAAPNDPLVQVLWWVTGDGHQDLARLATQVAQPAFTELDKDLEVTRLLVHRMPWPEGRPLVAALEQTGGLFSILNDISALHPDLKQELSQPATQLRIVEQAGDKAVNFYDTRIGTAYYERGSRGSPELLAAMATSSKPLVRGLAAMIHGFTGDLVQIRTHLADQDPRVRLAVLDGLVRAKEHPKGLEPLLVPILSDPDPDMVLAGHKALIDPRIHRWITERGSTLFRFGSLTNSFWISYDYNDLPPLVFAADTAGVLAALAQRKTTDRDPPDLGHWQALLMAQYGKPDALVALIPRLGNESDDQQLAKMLMLGLPLTKDPRFLPLLRAKVEQAEGREGLVPVLDALIGVPGTEARALRRLVNERLAGLK